MLPAQFQRSRARMGRSMNGVMAGPGKFVVLGLAGVVGLVLVLGLWRTLSAPEQVMVELEVPVAGQN